MGSHGFPEILITPSVAFARPEPRAGGSAGRRTGGGSAAGAPVATAAELAEDARQRAVWERFIQQARDREAWTRRHMRRAWLLGTRFAGWAAQNWDTLREHLPDDCLPLFDPELLKLDGWPNDGPAGG